MATPKTAQKNRSESPETTSDHIEEKVVAFAGQLGFLIGTVQAKAEGWLDRTALSKTIGQIRDSAADLLDQVNSKSPLRKKAGAQPNATGGFPVGAAVSARRLSVARRLLADPMARAPCCRSQSRACRDRPLLR